MGLAVRNLAAINYLHSNKHNFFNNIENYGVFGKLQKTDKLNETLKILKADLETAKIGEKGFYEDFGVSSPQEWSRTYLRIGKNRENEKGEKDNKIAILTNIFHSVELYRILSKHSSDNNKLKNVLREMASTSNLTKGQKNKIFKILNTQAPVALSEVFSKLGLFDKGGRKKQQEFFNEFLSASNKIVESTLQELVAQSVDEIKGTLRSANSDKLKKIEKLITKQKGDNKKKLDESTNFIRRKMNENPIFSGKDKNIVINMWEELFWHDIYHDDGRVVSDSIEKVEGKVQELERRITLSEAFLSFSLDDFFSDLTPQELEKNYTVAGIKTLVQSTGDKLVSRYRNESASRGTADKEAYQQSESKTDSVFLGKSGKLWRIQEKNSISDMYSQFDTSGDPDKLTRKFGQIKLQSNVKFSTLEQYFREGKNMFSNEDLQYLSYLLINFNALNKWSAGEDEQLWKADGYSKKTKTEEKKQTAFKAAFTIDLIDSIMSRGIKVFISDLILPDRVSAGAPIDFENWNFIIYRGQILLPLSYIIEQLILFLKDVQKSTMALRTYSGLENITAGYLKDIYSQKLASTENDPDKDKKDYHWDNLVNIGVEAGRYVKENLIIKGIYLKFNTQAIKNLINPQLLG